MKQHFKWLDLVCFIFTNCDKLNFNIDHYMNAIICLLVSAKIVKSVDP